MAKKKNRKPIVVFIIWLSVSFAIATVTMTLLSQEFSWQFHPFISGVIIGSISIPFWGPALLSVIFIYNKLITIKNKGEKSWQDIEVQLQRRLDLIPRLVKTTESILTHEKSTLESVIQARNQSLQSTDRGERIMAETSLSSALGSVLGRITAIAESYPKIVSNSNVMALHDELITTENNIAELRISYNAAVQNYNDAIGVFPKNLVAMLFEFHQEVYFKINEPTNK